MMGRRLGMALTMATLAAVLAAALPAQGQPLVADLSKHHIAITSSFTGTEVLLYGAIDGEGDLVIVVRGPEERVAVRRKERIAGVWMNRDKVEFGGVPAYYAVASSRPLEEIATSSFLDLHEIGLDSLRFTPLTEQSTKETAAFREALVRNRVRAGLYSAEAGTVGFLGDRLFRTTLYFPANVPTGPFQAQYKAEVFLIRDGQVVSAETTPLFISKTGFQADINFYARTQPALYGAAAILIALVAGWVAAAVFRKR